ncbi:efflux RND transporter periplasmic adaptor subunit [Pelagibius sp. Alg239-R121]|uniref:efflux RND transporter periplasmic adaptor subunit n=1 Tax=Pelagibius sp. Alg239-R121 TaxID=2993448 RepID=UPI0024A66DD3|nr:efflux RND transporter periplasmic adaptor subunit [Pelagibius sp. Alg239-R121]
MKRSLVIAVVLALVVVGWIASGQMGHSDNAPVVQKPPANLEASTHIASVRVRAQSAVPYRVDVVLRGSTEAIRKVNVKAEAYGRVVELNSEKGHSVKSGDIIVRLSPEERPAMLEEARALYEQRRIEYEAARKLSKKGFRAETQLAASKADLQAADAAVKRAKVALENIVIRAPFDGFVDDRMVEIGDFIDKGDPITKVVDLDPILVVTQINERAIKQLSVGEPGYARLITGDNVEGKIRFISTVADPQTRTFRVEIEVPNPDRKIPDGLSADVRLPLEEINAHLVSPAILSLTDEGEVGVKIVTSENLVKFVPATIVANGASGVWLTGLPEAVALITVGQEFVTDGQKVNPIDEATLEPIEIGSNS